MYVHGAFDIEIKRNSWWFLLAATGVCEIYSLLIWCLLKKITRHNAITKVFPKIRKLGSEIPASWENDQGVAAMNEIHLHENKRPFTWKTLEPTVLASRKNHGRQEKNEKIGSIHIVSEKFSTKSSCWPRIFYMKNMWSENLRNKDSKPSCHYKCPCI